MATLNAAKYDVMEYSTGNKIGTVRVPAPYADAYESSTNPRFHWPEGIATLADAFDADHEVECDAPSSTVIFLE